jgi:hypothetical protein
MTPALMIFLAQLILVLPIVHDTTNRRDRVGGDFHQVIAAFLSLAKSVRCWEDAQLLSLRTNDTNFSNSDFTIHTQFGNDRPPLFFNVYVEVLVGGA